MAWNESRKRPYSEMEDMYAGPEDFMEAGARGFLVMTLPKREEPAIDQAMKMLRKACVKLHGGMKPQVKSTTALFSNGYIAVDFMDPEAVTILPNTELKSKIATGEEEVKEGEQEADNAEKTETGTDGAGDGGDGKEVEKEDIQKEEEMEKEIKETEEQNEEMEADKSVDKSTEAGDDAPTDQDTPSKDKSKEASEEKKKGGDTDDKDSKSKESPAKGGDEEKSKTDSERSNSRKEDDRRKRDNKRRRREMDTTPKWPLMKAPYKFKAYRTELRNIMFIKSNIPDPLALVVGINDLILDRKPLKSDSINQLLPIQGICNYSYWELEVMSRRVLAPFFPDDLEEPPNFAILMLDKLSEPGADVLAEIVRSSIWSINPFAWQADPLSGADVTVQLELIGSKIVLSAMTHYMKYRHYSPFCVSELGEGKAEDSEEPEKRRPEKGKPDRSDRNGRSRSQSDRPQKTDENPSEKGEEKAKDGDDHEKDDSKKDMKDKEEDSTKVETKEESEENAKEDAKQPEKKEETGKSGETEWKKTRRGTRGGVRKKKNK